jgi:hypothetical protein
MCCVGGWVHVTERIGVTQCMVKVKRGFGLGGEKEKIEWGKRRVRDKKKIDWLEEEKKQYFLSF